VKTERPDTTTRRPKYLFLFSSLSFSRRAARVRPVVGQGCGGELGLPEAFEIPLGGAGMLFGKRFIRGLVMTQKKSSGKVMHLVFFVLAVAVLKLILHNNPNLWIDLLPECIASEEDKKLLKDPKAAWTKSNEGHFHREVKQSPQPQQSQGGLLSGLGK
jgi:hypothetical protein